MEVSLSTPAAPSTATSNVPNETIERAVTSLLKWNSLKSETLKPQLLSSDEFLYLILTLHKIPSKGRTNAYKIPLPTPLFSSNGDAEICVILDDRHISSKSAKQKVLEEKIPVSKIIKFSKLKTDYKPFESKRKLCDSYNLFFADKRIIPLLPSVIGSHFYKKKKIPVPIELGRNNWKEQIERVCSCGLLFLNTGTCSVVKVAKAEMGKVEIVENVVAAVNGVAEFVPKKWGNVRSIHLKFSDSVALPIYQAVPEMKMKIDGMVVVKDDDNVALESEKDDVSEKKSKKVGKKKGRIHEVRYMDSVGFSEMVGEDELGSDDDREVIKGEMGISEIHDKKRKKGLKQKKEKVSGKLVKKSKKSKVAV